MTNPNGHLYASLHTHSHGSILDGYSTVPELVAEAQKLGQKHLAITDHGTLFMAYELYSKATAAGIHPVIGIEAYVAPSHVTRFHHEPAYFAGGGPDDVSSKGSYTHMLLFAKNNQGLEDLFHMTFLSYKEGNWRKNRIDIDLLRKYGKNLIGTTGCPSGELQTKLRLGMIEEAEEYVQLMQDIFGKENYYMELMNHDMSIDLERSVEPELLRIAEKYDIPLLATADSHYTTADQSKVHEHMLCISTHSKMSVPTTTEEGEGGKTRFAFDGTGYHMNSYDEMIRKFPEHKYPNAVTNTVKLAEKCQVTILPNPDLRPKIEIPEGHTEASYLREQAWEGFHRRFPDPERGQNKEYLDRLTEELDVIIQMNYPGYFLVVSDFIRWAKNNGIRVGPGRGSAAGSLLAYVLDITDAEPIRHGLLFSRFISLERPSPPDVDIDFDDRKRELVINYVREKYGEDHVAQVATYGMLKAKNAVKDILRIYDEPYSTGDLLTKAMPEAIFGKTMPLKDMYTPGAPRYDEAADFRNLVTEFGTQDRIDIARQLEGRVRSTGVHACAVIISSQPVMKNVPTMVRKDDGAYITQWEYPVCEDLGLLKMDFLGLRNLGIIDEAIKLIKKRHNIDINMQEIVEGPMDDPKTYRLLQSGRTLGVFQLDSGPIQDLLKLMNADRFDDISAVLALYRPGPMGVGAHTSYALRKTGKEEVQPIHPEIASPLEPILGETQQIIVYQEQIMKLAQVLSGYTLGEADLLRRAMGKKKKEEMDAQWEKFHDGGIANGYSEEALKAVWDTVLPFADYAFNKSHSVAYGLISYMTAYLKANYTVEYMSALLSSVADDVDKTAEYLEDCRQLGIKVLPPDINFSEIDYIPVSPVGEPPVIRFGLKAIRGLGESTGGMIVNLRKTLPNGSFKSADDLFNNGERELINKRVLEGLANGGGLDSLGFSRRSWIYHIPELVKQFQKVQRSKTKTQTSLFDLDDVIEYKLYPMDEYPRLEKLKIERNALGLYVSGHPVDGLNLSAQSSVEIAGLFDGRVKPVEGFPDRNAQPIRIAGVITSLAVKRNKQGKPFAIMKLEDRSGSVECLMFWKQYEQSGSLLKIDEIYQFSGFARTRDESINFTVDSVKPLDFSASGNLSVRFKVTQGQWQAGEKMLRDRLANHPVPIGETGDDVIVSIKGIDETGEMFVRELKLDVKVHRSAALLQEIQELFGARCIGRWLGVKKKVVETEEGTPDDTTARTGTTSQTDAASPSDSLLDGLAED